MAKLVPVKFEMGTPFYIEGAESAVLPDSQAIQEASALDAAEKALQTAQQLSNSIKAFCGHLVGSLLELRDAAQPTKATIEFGLNISLEGNVYLVKSAGEASIKIRAEWELAKGGEKK